MENPRPEGGKIIKDIINLFRPKMEVEEVKDVVLRNIKNLFEYEKEEEIFYKLVRVNNFRSNDYKNGGNGNKIIRQW